MIRTLAAALLMLTSPLWGQTLDDFPLIRFNGQAGADVPSVTAANLVTVPGISDDPLFLGALVYEMPVEYTFAGVKRAETYYVVLGNVSHPKKTTGAVVKGEIMGTIGEGGLYSIAFAKEKTPFLVTSSHRAPYDFKGWAWFDSSFFFGSGATRYLSFNPTDDIAANAVQVAEDSLEAPGYVYYPDYRLRWKGSLAEYPRELTADERKGVAGFESTMYGRAGIYVAANEVNWGGHRYLLCWQAGFDKYLRDEYQLGQPLWFYGSIVTFDAFQKIGYVFLRDFSQTSIEEIDAARRSALP